MPTLNEVQQQIKALGEVDTFGTKKEIRYLPDILADDETVLALTSGLMDGNTWLIVCTERRVIFLDKGMIYGFKQRETPLERINSIEQETEMVFGSIGIWDGAALMKIEGIAKKAVRPFVEAVNRARDALKSAKGSNQRSAERYKVVFSGTVREGFSVEAVKTNLAKLFKIDAARVESLFSGNPIVVKQGIDAPTAGRYLAALTDAGAVCEMVPMDSTVAPIL